MSATVNIAAWDSDNPKGCAMPARHRPGDAWSQPPDLFPRDWDPAHWRPKNPRRDLIIAAALIVAEIERLDRIPEFEARKFAWTESGGATR